MESRWLQQRDALAALLLAVLVAAALGAIAYIRPVRRAETAQDDGAALRCTVDDRALVPDGSRTRIETSCLVGEVRFAQRREGKARCAIAVALGHFNAEPEPWRQRRRGPCRERDGASGLARAALREP